MLKRIVQKRCRECYRFISADAPKCKHCSAYQSKWKQRLVVFSPAISAFIALGALLATLTPRIAENFLDKKAVVELEVLDAKDGVLELFATNSGEKGAVLGNIRLSYDAIHSSYCEYVDLSLAVSSRVVKSGGELVLTTTENSRLPEKVNLSPLSPDERIEFEQLRNSEDNSLENWTLLNSFEQRQFITKCKLELSKKSSNTKFVHEVISYNCKP